MNKQEFISLIEQPEQLGKSNIAALKQVTADFPYFQAAQILLTKALYNDHHYEFEKQLKHTSLLVPDRAALFRYIHNLGDRQANPVVIQEPRFETVIEPVAVAGDPVQEIKQEEEPEITPIVEAAEEIISTEEKISPDIHVREPDLTDTENTTEKTPEPEIALAAEEKEVGVEEIQEIKSSEIHSFTEWLQMQQGKKPVVTEKHSEEKIVNEEIPVSEVPLSHEAIGDKTPMEIEIAEQVKRSNINEFESILDKFIRENPRISRGKAEFYNPVNMARQSVEEDDELVTETLANVYYKQGHHKKAIRAYEKLCLIYPHKMTYFASLIQKIKTETKE